MFSISLHKYDFWNFATEVRFSWPVWQQPEEKKTETEAEAEAGSEHLEQQRIQEVNRESCSQLENDILLKQQLMAKQQEILKLHQQRLEIELAKARAQIELQAKLLQKEKDAAKEREREAAKEREADAAAKISQVYSDRIFCWL